MGEYRKLWWTLIAVPAVRSFQFKARATTGKGARA